MILLAISLLAVGTRALSQDMSAEEKAVDAVAQRWAEAWDKGDLKAVSALYTADADFTDISGKLSKGPAEIEKALAQLRTTMYEGSKLTIQRTAIRFLKPSLAVVDGSWELSGAPKTEGPAPPSKGTYTTVMVKQDDQWLLAAHRSRIPFSPPATSPQ
jgi:uncharacterized protein (TIGR02246 family)